MGVNDMKKLGIYVHVPFCKSKCDYCDFASFTGREKDMERYTDAVCLEMKRRSEACGHPAADSVFFGGGTPSILPAELIGKLTSAVRKNFDLTDDCEWTVEMNPGTVNAEKADVMKSGGVNRISMGMQSCKDDLLKAVGRIHTAEDVREAVSIIRKAGFDNFNLDMMLGLPSMTMEDALDTVRFAAGLGAKHISCYALILEEGTRLWEDVKKGRVMLPGDDADRGQYGACRELMRQYGYHQYEISNFAMNGYECRHNRMCWEREDYLGFGCAAASLWNNERHTNPQTIDGYLNGEAGENETVTGKDILFEAVMLGLRLTEGISLADFKNRYGVGLTDVYGEALAPAVKDGRLIMTEERVFLTEKGMDLMNTVLEPMME